MTNERIEIMEKKYNQPSIEVTALMPTTIICASITFGGNAPEEITGD